MKTEIVSSQASAWPLKSVGIIYSTSDILPPGRENEKCADCEVIAVAEAIRAALTPHGIQVDLIDLDPDRMEGLKKYDYVFNLAETIYGFPLADHEVTAKLEQLKIHFTGAGSFSLRACLDKAFTKIELEKHGILTPAFELYFPDEPIHTALNYPLIVKPVHEDGSYGITSDSIVWNETDLQRQVVTTHRLYFQPALVEEFIDGKDVTASILGNGLHAICMPLSEIVYPEENKLKILTFEAKWDEESSDFRTALGHCPPRVNPDIQDEISRIALQAYNIMNCRDYARIDFRLRGDEIFLLEVNPNPCLNPQDSGFVRCGKAQGFDFDELIFKILEISFKNQGAARDSRSLGTHYEDYIENLVKNRQTQAATFVNPNS